MRGTYFNMHSRHYGLKKKKKDLKIRYNKDNSSLRKISDLLKFISPITSVVMCMHKKLDNIVFLESIW